MKRALRPALFFGIVSVLTAKTGSTANVIVDVTGYVQ
jgi:hypothetical protein